MTLATQTVRDIALENPATIRVFEALGIDYCCGGRKPLAEACAAKNLSVNEVLKALERVTARHLSVRSKTGALNRSARSLHTLSIRITRMSEGSYRGSRNWQKK